MKKTFYLIGLISIMLIIGMVIIGCSGGGSSPSTVVRQLHTAIEKQDSKKINQLMSAEAAAAVIMYGEKASGMISEYGGIEKTTETIDGNHATVEVTYKNGDKEEWELEKIDGKWKVTIDK